MDKETQEKLLTLKYDLPLFAKTCLKIVDKSGALTPLVFNDSQMQLHEEIEKQLKETGMVRMVVPKGRKQGVSTYVGARYFHKIYFSSYKNVFILTHLSDSTNALFQMVNRFYHHLPEPLKHKLLTDNSKELKFANESKYTVATAGEGEIGRGATPHFFHGSEVASYQYTDNIETGMFQSVALAEGTEMILESTAKGIGDLFHKYAMTAIEGRSVWRLCFLPWYIEKTNSLPIPRHQLPLTLSAEDKQFMKDHPSVTLEQIYWRQIKVEEMKASKFRHEYPATVQEAFESSDESFFDSERIRKARQSPITDNQSPYVVGIDAARSGDRTIFCHRRGRQILKIEKFDNMDEMRLVGLISNMINRDQPDQVFIDVASAYGAIDRLHELGFNRVVQGVHNSETPMDTSRFSNKRAETAFALRDWLDEDVSMPDDDDIEFDLMGIPMSKETSSGKAVLESKENIKKKIRKSPDIFDAMCLTFAYPVRGKNQATLQNTYSGYNGGTPPKKGDFVSPVMKSFERNGDPQNSHKSLRTHFER